MYTTNDDRDLLDLYIAELRSEPVLNAQQQKELARVMRAAKTDDAREHARSELIRANLRFAFSVAKQYQNRGVPLGDLVSEANAGLVRAADKYDPDVGVNFISYAVWWIRQQILQSLAEQARIVRLPLNKIGSINRINKAFARSRRLTLT